MTADQVNLGFDVSCETMARLAEYAARLRRWNKTINLVARSTLSDLWNRHIADSAQLADLAPDTPRWLDLGSGAGLPGLIVAALRPDCEVELVESDTRKCAFLGEAARAMGISVRITNARIETAASGPSPVISARALAPLPRLFDLAWRFSRADTCFLFPKGARVDMELASVEGAWRFKLDRTRSRTDPDGVILRIQGLEPR